MRKFRSWITSPFFYIGFMYFYCETEFWKGYRKAMNSGKRIEDADFTKK